MCNVCLCVMCVYLRECRCVCMYVCAYVCMSVSVSVWVVNVLQLAITNKI